MCKCRYVSTYVAIPSYYIHRAVNKDSKPFKVYRVANFCRVNHPSEASMFQF